MQSPTGFALKQQAAGSCTVASHCAGRAMLSLDQSGCLELQESWLGSTGRPRVKITGKPDGAGYVLDIERLLDGARRVYIAQLPRGVAISSHISLLKHAGIRTAIDDASLAEAMLYRFVMAPRTLFKGITQLRAGERAQIRLGPSGVSVSTVGLFRSPASSAPSGPDAADRIWQALTDAHHAYGLNPAEFGTLLSGGLDSSILASIGAKLYGNRRTYSCSYGLQPEAEDTELQYAVTAANWMGTTHTLHVPTKAQFLHTLIDAALAAEQSSIHLQSALVHSVVRHSLAPAGIKSWTCGEGADGLFSQKIQRVIHDLGSRPFARAGLCFPFAKTVLQRTAAATNRFGMLADLAGRGWSDRTAIDDPEHAMWAAAVFGDRAVQEEYFPGNPIAGRAECLRPYADQSLQDKFLLINILGEVAETEAVWGASSESEGVEAIFPFTAPEVVTAVSQVPWAERFERSKGLLRDAARKNGVPAEIIDRPKASFDIRPSFYGPSGSILEPLLRVAEGGVDAKVLRSLQSSHVLKSQMLFTALNVGIIRRHFESGVTRDQLHEELDRAIRDLGVWEQMTKPTVPPG
ncbi:MAG: asparagine synthase-related protein [Phycisphaerales bacterium]